MKPLSNGNLLLVCAVATIVAVALAPPLRSFGAPIPAIF